MKGGGKYKTNIKENIHLNQRFLLKTTVFATRFPGGGGVKWFFPPTLACPFLREMEENMKNNKIYKRKNKTRQRRR